MCEGGVDVLLPFFFLFNAGKKMVFMISSLLLFLEEVKTRLLFFWTGEGKKSGAASSAPRGEGHGALGCCVCTLHPARRLPGNILDRSRKVKSPTGVFDRCEGAGGLRVT